MAKTSKKRGVSTKKTHLSPTEKEVEAEIRPSQNRYNLRSNNKKREQEIVENDVTAPPAPKSARPSQNQYNLRSNNKKREQKIIEKNVTAPPARKSASKKQVRKSARSTQKSNRTRRSRRPEVVIPERLYAEGVREHFRLREINEILDNNLGYNGYEDALEDINQPLYFEDIPDEVLINDINAREQEDNESNKFYKSRYSCLEFNQPGPAIPFGDDFPNEGSKGKKAKKKKRKGPRWSYKK